MDENKKKALSAALMQIDKQFGKGSVMRMGDVAAFRDIDVVSTGSLGLDIALGCGGLPRGRVVEIYGPESSGKTTLTLQVIAEMQKLGGTAAFVDAEHALDPSYAEKIGVNLDDLLVSQPDTGEQALEITDMLVRSGAVDIVVVDSVAALTPKAEIEGDMGDSHMGVDHHRGRDRHGGGGRGGRGGVAGAFAEADLHILPESQELVLEPALGVLQLLDAAVRLPEFLLEPVDPEHHRRRPASVLLLLRGLAGEVGRRGGLRGSWRLAVKKVEILRDGGRGARHRGDEDRGQAHRLGGLHEQPRLAAPRARRMRRKGRMGAASSGRRQLSGAPFSTVTARRFCDQQEMSSHTATGRSLP